MSHRWRLGLLISGLLLLALLLSWPLLGTREPSYAGGKLSQWLETYTDQLAPGDSDQAYAAVRHIGTNAVPCLLNWLEYRPLRWPYRVKRLLRGMPNPLHNHELMDMSEKGMERSSLAVVGFSILKTDAREAVPELARLMHNTNNVPGCWQATYALAYLGKDALPPLLKELQHPVMPHTYHVVSAIGYMGYLGTNAEPALPPVISLLTNGDVIIAQGAALSLGNLGIRPDVCVPALQTCLGNSNNTLRMLSARSLGNFGAQARPAMSALSNLLTDSDSSVRDAASNALVKISPRPLGAGEH